MPFVEKQGTHGTTKTRYNKIKKEGFKKTTGRGGKGAYFWSEGFYAERLAIGWYQQRYSQGYYGYDDNANGVVIYVKLETDSTQILDLEDLTLKNEIALLAEEKGVDVNNQKAISTFYDMYVNELENEQHIIGPAPKKLYTTKC